MRNERGSFSLIGIMLAMAIMLVMLAAIAPAYFRQQQVESATSASQSLAVIGQDEKVYAQVYGAYVPLPNLIGTVPTAGNPISCLNSFLADNADIQAPAGFTLTFTPGAAQTASAYNCPGVNGYTSYQIHVDPNSRIVGTRHFFLDETGSVRFNDGAPATSSSPIVAVRLASQGPVSAILAGGSGVCPSGYSGTPPNCIQNQVPQTCPSGDTGTPPNCVAPPPPPGIGGGNASASAYGNPTYSVIPAFANGTAASLTTCYGNNSPACVNGNPFSNTGAGKTAVQFSVSVSPPDVVGGLRVGLVDLDKVAGSNQIVNAFNAPYNSLVCDITSTNPGGCTAFATGYVIDPNDRLQVYITDNNGGDQSSPYTISWTISYQ